MKCRGEKGYNLVSIYLLIFNIQQQIFPSMFKYNSEHKPSQWDILK